MVPGSKKEPVLHYKVLETFQNFKHGVGEPVVDSIPKIAIQLYDSCLNGTVCEELGIKDGQIKLEQSGTPANCRTGAEVLCRDEIKAVFDQQINKIIRLIDEQLESVQGPPVCFAAARSFCMLIVGVRRLILPCPVDWDLPNI